MSKTSMCDYVVLWDAGFTISAGQEKSKQIAIPTDYTTGPSSTRPMITFYVDGKNTADFKIDVNDTPVASFIGVTGTGSTISIVFPSSLLDAGENNTVQFRVSNGKAQFAAIVLWYQRTIGVAA